jgi:flagellar biosynthesis protein FlhG
MSDQADSLRALAEWRTGQTKTVPSASMRRATRVVHFAGAKGGVGTSSLVVNLGIALARAGESVRLVDANPINHDLAALGGMFKTDARRMRGRVDLVSSMSFGSDDSGEPADYLLVDAGHELNRPFLEPNVTPEFVVVTTPEPIALDAAERLVRRTHQSVAVRWRVVMAQTASVFEAREELSAFLCRFRESPRIKITALGHVRTDDCMRHAVRARIPVVAGQPHSAAARCIVRMATALRRDRAAPALRLARLEADAQSI